MASQLTKLTPENSNIMSSSSKKLYYLPFSYLVVCGEKTTCVLCWY